MARSTTGANDSTAPATAVFATTTTCSTSNSRTQKTRVMKSIRVLTVWIAAAVSSSLSSVVVVESRIITTAAASAVSAASASAAGSSGEPNVSKVTQHQRQRWRNRPSVVIGDPSAEVGTTTTAATSVTHVREDEDEIEDEFDDLEEDIIKNDGGWLGDLNQVLHTNQMNIMEFAGGGGRGGVSPYGLAVDRHDVTMTYKQLEMAMSMPATVRPFWFACFILCLFGCLLVC